MSDKQNENEIRESVINKVIRHCNVALSENEVLPTREIIEDMVEKACKVVHIMEPDLKVRVREKEIAFRTLTANHDVRMEVGQALVSEENFEPWYDQALAEIDPYYWSRYRNFLAEEKGFPRSVTASISRDTEKILSYCENPKKEGRWDRRGMVVGHVQSGKTANYSGLVCKAADAGYKLIIIIAGISSDLRNQTQSRIDEGFIGQDSEALLKGIAARKIGVGNFTVASSSDASSGMEHPSTFTSATRDFNKAKASGLGISLKAISNPVVFVIKKNTGILKNLIEWLKVQNTRNEITQIKEPLLVIDDEADNASINTKSKSDEVSRINGQIRELLELFERSTYVGYTATPFANIFIDPKSDDEMFGHDLFPRDFIYTLNPPDNYMGPAEYFSGQEAESRHVRLINDNGDLLPISHKKHHSLIDLPWSLKKAIRTFVLAAAIRRKRGDSKKHCSMMINASVFVNIQQQLVHLVHDEWEKLRDSIRSYARLKDPTEVLKDQFLKELHEVWNEEFSDAEESWDDIRMILLETILKIKVLSTNSRSSEKLDYGNHPEGLHVIAIGGLTLSRGLTLEGLCVSYFLRNTKMYDTLMQMGRWFGYRPNYADLCRVWLPNDSLNWYRHVMESVEELREDLLEMVRLNMSPKEFGLKVRRHPSSLMITARNRMGRSERIVHRVSLSGRLIETYRLLNSKTDLEQNRDNADRLYSSLAGVSQDKREEGELYKGVAPNEVISFVESFKNHRNCLLTDPEKVASFIRKITDNGSSEWDVLFAGTQRSDRRTSRFPGVEMWCQRRTIGENSTKDVLEISNRRRVSRAGIDKIGFSDKEIREIQKEWELKNPKKPNVPDFKFRYRRSRPLLVIHEIEVVPDPNKEGLTDFIPDEPVIAWSISFPVSEIRPGFDDTVEFEANTTYMEQLKLEWNNEAEEEDE